MIQQTSLEAFEEIKEDLQGKRLEVYNALKQLKTANNTTIALFLRWPINRVTPRIKELREMRYVIESHKGLCPYTKKNTIYWVCKAPATKTFINTE